MRAATDASAGRPAADPPAPAGRDWRGPVLAAAATALTALPGALLVPVLDRDEARFVQASAQMLERRDPVNIRFQDAPRDKKPVGIHWLQAVAAAPSGPERRDVVPYRLPSMLGAMLAAGACAWGAAAFFSARTALAAGLILGLSALLSTEAMIAKTDAVLCGAVTLAMAALAHRYAAARGGAAAPRGTRVAFWGALALGVLVKGPVAPMVAGLCLIALWATDRDAAWMRRLGWGWGLLLVGLVVGPWAAAITVATDGGFWTGAVGGDLASKVAGGSEGHGGPPGVHALLAPWLLFPAGFLIIPAAVLAWRRRREPGVRFALAWLAPAWLVFELLPTKLPHYTLPLYAALGWLAAEALMREGAEGRIARWAGAALALLGAALFVALPLAAAHLYGGRGASGWAGVSAGLALLSGAVAAAGLLSGRPRRAAAAALVLGGGAHMVLAGGELPRLGPLWVSARAAEAVRAAGLDPRNGVTPGPVAVAGYAEPSLVFLLGTATELGAPQDAAQAVAEGRPALVEAGADAAFRAALAPTGYRARSVARISGYDYADGRPVTLTLWRPLPAPGAPS